MTITPLQLRRAQPSESRAVKEWIMDRHLTDAEAQAVMGHTSYQMGRRYTHVSHDAIREALERATGKPN